MRRLLIPVHGLILHARVDGDITRAREPLLP